MNKTYAVVLLICCALIVEFWRALPFAVFRKRRMPDILKRLSAVLPAAIMAILLVYGLKDLPSAGSQEWISVLIACAVTAILHIWKGSSILSIAAGTVIYVLLINML
jgi:branched-subunit amino acid transport protein AzlD